MLVVVALTVAATRRSDPPRLFSEGIAADRNGRAVPVQAGATGHYIPHTSFFVPDDSRLRGAFPDPGRAAVTESRTWLTAGRVPATYRPMVERALLDLRLLTGNDGAIIAGTHPKWRYVWPRDASFAAAALSVTRHHAEAAAILTFLRRICPGGGVWQARYRPDGSGRAPDDRGVQLDGSGWVPWATWVWFTTDPDRRQAARTLADLWPIVARSADAATNALRRNGLPAPSADYWEKRERKVTLGTVAPVLLGLRAASDLAKRTGRHQEAARWSRAAQRLAGALANTFGERGYPRTVPDGGDDTAITFLAPPFAPQDPSVRAAVERAARSLRTANGGIKPGFAWKRDGISWTAETALFALAEAGSGDHEKARTLLRWLSEHRTPLGVLPEKVDPAGNPVSVAPLAWTDAVVILTSATLDSDPGLAPPA